MPDEKEELREREKELSRHNSLLRVTPRDFSDSKQHIVIDTSYKESQFTEKEKGLHETDF